MRKKIIQKGNVRRGDFVRAVVTDTLPEEVPIIFSNDGFYLNRSKDLIKNQIAKDFIEAVLNPQKSYTKPYRYSVLRNSFSARGLSLIHPSAQLQVASFYQKYDSLICYLCSKSIVSLRAPAKVGTTFFVKGPNSEKNKFKGGSVGTVSIEKSVSNPSSYFAYRHLTRAHEFFDSNDYLHMEKKFSIFRSLDVSKCFNSIYTHTLYWAVDDVQSAKEHTSSVGFSNEFDRLMQSMNYNETNGICIGPEISRVFAEIIFSEVDKRVISYLKKRDLSYKADYEIRRYVDDYYLFCDSDVVADRVTAAIETCLSQFNLHLNDNKTNTIYRPFSTKISKIISDTNDILKTFFNMTIYNHSFDDDVVSFPKKIHRSDSVLRFIINKIKSICATHDTSYETVSDYVVSAFSKRVTDIVDGHERLGEFGEANDDLYVSSLMLFIEIIYFFYTVNPTVRSSLHVARAIITSTRMFRDNYPERLPFLAESIVRWTLDLAKAISRGDKHKDLTAVPVEVLNILLPMKEIAENELLVDQLISQMCEDVSSFEYFEIVTFIFLFGGRAIHREKTMRLFSRAKEVVENGLGPRVDSQTAHLCLDLLCCPFLPLDKRSSWFNNLRPLCGLPRVSRANAQDAVAHMTTNYWFVRWDRVDLLAQLRKKQLSKIY